MIQVKLQQIHCRWPGYELQRRYFSAAGRGLRRFVIRGIIIGKGGLAPGFLVIHREFLHPADRIDPFPRLPDNDRVEISHSICMRPLSPSSLSKIAME